MLKERNTVVLVETEHPWKPGKWSV